jgi:hypothetical protein
MFHNKPTGAPTGQLLQAVKTPTQQQHQQQQQMAQ